MINYLHGGFWEDKEKDRRGVSPGQGVGLEDGTGDHVHVKWTAFWCENMFINERKICNRDIWRINVPDQSIKLQWHKIWDIGKQRYKAMEGSVTCVNGQAITRFIWCTGPCGSEIHPGPGNRSPWPTPRCDPEWFKDLQAQQDRYRTLQAKREQGTDSDGSETGSDSGSDSGSVGSDGKRKGTGKKRRARKKKGNDWVGVGKKGGRGGRGRG